MANIAAGNVSGNFNSGGNICVNRKRTGGHAQARSPSQHLCRRFNLTRDVRVESVPNAAATRSGIGFSPSLKSRITRSREESLARRSMTFDSTGDDTHHHAEGDWPDSLTALPAVQHVIALMAHRGCGPLNSTSLVRPPRPSKWRLHRGYRRFECIRRDTVDPRSCSDEGRKYTSLG
jgi:hypothetical protein